MPWPLEIFYSCQMFNCLPFPGALFDQPQFMIDAINVCRNTERAARSRPQDLDRVGTSIKRIVDIMRAKGLPHDKYIRRVRNICGASIFNESGDLSIDEFQRLGIELIYGDVLNELHASD